MELFTHWCGFIGAWLLVAGPIYQASLELRSEDIVDRDLETAAKQIAKPPKISAWWWLLPPIKLYLERRRSNQYRRAFISVLSPEDTQAMISFINKATGWLFVAAGGLLIATKETYELTEALELAGWAFWAAVVGLSILCVLNTAYRIARSERVIAKAR